MGLPSHLQAEIALNCVGAERKPTLQHLCSHQRGAGVVSAWFILRENSHDSNFHMKALL